MNENNEKVETEKISYNRILDESTKKGQTQQSEHLKEDKKQVQTVKESYNRIPDEE